MGTKINYETFLKEFDLKLKDYFEQFGENICCHKGCSECCETGDYPMSDIELQYLMLGYAELTPEIKIIVQKNIADMKKGGACPFLINKGCSVYKYRPIICRVHGLAYYYNGEKVKIPHCANTGKNFSKIYKNGEFYGTPIKLNLDTYHILEGIYSDIKNLYDWIHNENG